MVVNLDMTLLLIQTSSKVGNQHLEDLNGPQVSWILQPQSVRIASKQPDLWLSNSKICPLPDQCCVWQPLGNSTKGRVGGTKNQSFLACAESKEASMSFGHGNMVFPLPVHQLSMLCHLQPFTVIAFRWMWLHWSTCFVLGPHVSYLPAVSGFLLKSHTCNLHIPSVIDPFSILSHHCVTSLSALFFQSRLVPSGRTYLSRFRPTWPRIWCSFRLPANHTRDHCHLLLVSLVPSRELHVLE